MYQPALSPNTQASPGSNIYLRERPHLISVSIDHHLASLEFLERVEQRETAIVTALSAPELSAGSVTLSTCNRFEAYLEIAGHLPIDEHRSAVFERLALAAEMPHEAVAEASTFRANREAAEHLFSVAGGLESAVVGEGEISGQVRRALDRAREAGTVTSELERLFQTAARTSREIKHRTAIQSRGRSLVRLALAMAESRINDWAQAPIVVVGTGAYAGATVAALSDRGAKNVWIHSPSGRAAEFAERRGVHAVAPDAFDQALATAELVITCSHAQDPIVSAELISRTTAAQPRLFIDLGMPRNVDPAAAALPRVELLDLETIALHAPVAELSAATEAKRIAESAADEFVAVSAERDAVPALRAMRAHVNEVLEAEVARAGDQPEIVAALRHFAGRVMHEPTLRVREFARHQRSESVAAVSELFATRP